MTELREFYSKNIELSNSDKVKYYLFIPQLKMYKCDELSELVSSSTYDVDGECIVIETTSSFMKYKALLESYEWLESIDNHPDKKDRCIVKLLPKDLNAYNEFLKSRYSKMYKNPEVLMKSYLISGTQLSKFRALRTVQVLSHGKDYQEFLEEYLNLKQGILNDIELDSKIQS